MRRTLSVLLCALLWAGAAPAATVYKWVDEAGRVHYGSSPPPAVAAEEIRVGTPGDPAGGEDAGPGDAQTAPGAPEGETTADDAGDPAAEDRRQMRAINCRIAQRNLETLEALPDAVMEQDTEGGLVRLTPEEVEARLERARADVEQYCR